MRPCYARLNRNETAAGRVVRVQVGDRHGQRRTMPSSIGRMPQVVAFGQERSRSHSPEKSRPKLEDDCQSNSPIRRDHRSPKVRAPYIYRLLYAPEQTRALNRYLLAQWQRTKTGLSFSGAAIAAKPALPSFRQGAVRMTIMPTAYRPASSWSR